MACGAYITEYSGSELHKHLHLGCRSETIQSISCQPWASLRISSAFALVQPRTSTGIWGIAFTVYAVSEAVLTIWRAASPLELGRLLSGPQRQLRRLGLNFSVLGEEDKRARKGPKTIEIHILEGILKEDLMFGWLHICCKWVELAMIDRQTQFRDAIKHSVRFQEAEGKSQPDRTKQRKLRATGTQFISIYVRKDPHEAIFWGWG